MARISIRNLRLDVPLYVQSERSAKSWVGMIVSAAFQPPKREYATLLQDINLEASDGDRIAIIGRNGAGKSTLLQVLTGAYRPTQGSVVIEGSRQALLNIALGFSGEATVKENILLRSSAMGMKLASVRDHIDEILDFAGLKDKASHRLQTLSTGQKMRLGFSISTTLQHDVMLLDEWIGTGDVQFVQKASDRMMSRVDGSKIVVVASHSSDLLRKVCNRGILLEKGRLIFDGSVEDTIGEYENLLAKDKKK